MSEVYAYETRVDMMLVDGNNHMRNSAYLDVATASRYRYFEDRGFSQDRFTQMGFGAVIRWERIEYKREVRHLDSIRVELHLSGASPEVSRYRFHNVILKNGEVAAIVVTEAGWLDLKERKLIIPPDEMKAVIRGLQPTENFEELRESVRPVVAATRQNPLI